MGLARLSGLWLVLLALAVGCARSPSYAPPTVQLGEDICAECGMSLVDERFIAAYVREDGEARLFDDIGDMLLYHKKHQEKVQVFYVRDYDRKSWLKAEAATFVLSPQIQSPMGWGLAAFEDRARAEAFAREVKGEVLSFQELLERDLQPAMPGMKMDK